MSDTFEMRREMVDVTSLHRPDPSWRETDASGHIHEWYTEGRQANDYRPDQAYTLPTLRWIEEVPATDDYPAIGHYECVQCGLRVGPPQFTADVHHQHIPGLLTCLINGERVTPEEFQERWKAAKAATVEQR